MKKINRRTFIEKTTMGFGAAFALVTITQTITCHMLHCIRYSYRVSNMDSKKHAG